LLNIDPLKDEVQVGENSSVQMPKAKVAAWSKDGISLAIADPDQGVLVLDLADAEGLALQEGAGNLNLISGSPKTTQTLFWSPKRTTLVAISQVAKGSTEPNIYVWRRSNPGCEESGGGSTGKFLTAATFSHPKLEKDKRVLSWTVEERYCARLCPDGKVHLHNGEDLAAPPIMELTFSQPANTFEFWPIPGRNPLTARLAVFVPDVRDDMQRAVAPGECSIWEVISEKYQDNVHKRATIPISSGQNGDLKWSPTGTAVLALCTTEVDESGKSYFGGSKLVLISHDGSYTKDLTESDETTTNGTSVQAVQWSPNRDEFILIRGFQPAQVLLFTWDSRAQQVHMVKILLEKAHRNTIRFNSFGSLVCLAGFGNLVGDMDFFGRVDDDKCDYVRVSSCTANCTVSSEWAPDGRHFLTAVLAPRMRVDNGFAIWRALTGTKVAEQAIEELFEAQWRPEPEDSLKYLNVSPEEVDRATKGLANRTNTQNEGKKKAAYRPPKARGAEGSNSVAAMMRGEAAVPDNDDRRGRRPWQPRQPRDNEDPTASPALAPSEPPAAPSPPGRERPEPESPAPGTEGLEAVPLPAALTRTPPAQRPPLPPWATEQSAQTPTREPPATPPGAFPMSPPPQQHPQAVPPAPPPQAPAPRRQNREASQQQQGQPPAQPPQQPPSAPPSAPPSQPPSAPPSQPPQPQGAGYPAATAAANTQAAAVAAAERAASAAVAHQQQQQKQQQQREQQLREQQQREAQQQREQQQREAQQQQREQQQRAAAAAAAQQAAQQAAQEQLRAQAAALGYSQQAGPQGSSFSYGESLQYLQQMQRQQAQQAQAQQAQALLQAQAQGHAHADQVLSYGAGRHMGDHADLARYAQRQHEPGGPSRQALAFEAVAQAAQSQQAQQDKRPCPTSGWQYVDPKGHVQGPFNLLEMQLWNSMGYFRPDLPMRCDPKDAFTPFNQMFPAPLVPFESYPRRQAQNGSENGRMGGR